MTQTAQALQAFFGNFDMPAYVEDNVPDDAKLPYITYELTEPNWRNRAGIHARVWYRADGFAMITDKVDEIRAFIGEGISIRTESGAVRLWQDDVFCQFIPMPGDPSLKCAYLTMEIQATTH